MRAPSKSPCVFLRSEDARKSRAKDALFRIARYWCQCAGLLGLQVRVIVPDKAPVIAQTSRETRSCQSSPSPLQTALSERAE